jgi:hypothetical protein
LRDPFFPPVCDLCRSRLAARLWELRDLASLLPAALSPGRNEPQRVSGSKEVPLPLVVAALDRAGPARPDGVRDQLVPVVRAWRDVDQVDGDGHWFGGWHREVVRDEAGTPLLTAAHDQDGAPSVAAVLDSWARDWSETFDLPLPPATVPALVSWLSRHLAYALAHHPAIEEFATEVTSTLYAVRALLNVSRAPIHLADACPACGVTALKRFPGEPETECGNCHEVTEFVGLPIEEEQAA